jgi:SAM-dependent methyltransferase
MIHFSYCPLCSSEKIEHFLESNDFFLSGEKFSLFRCYTCGFIFTQDHPDETNTGKYYESDEYISHDDSATGLSNVIYRRVRSVMLKRKRSIVKKLTAPEKGKLLDIGSGTGHFLSEMKRAGWEVKGIEINEKARDFSVSKLGLNVLPPSELKSLPSSGFDCITLWHVLEHFYDPLNIASEIRRLLNPEGVCVVALPNCSSYDAQHYSEYWAAWDVPRHLWHFSPETFRLFSEKNGFTLTGIKSLPLDVFYISSISEKYKGTKLPFIKGMITGSWFFLSSLFSRNKTSSLIYILSPLQ